MGFDLINIGVEKLRPMSRPIQIYIDANACSVKSEIYRVAERHGLKVFVVSERSPD